MVAYGEHYGKIELDASTGGSLTDYSAGVTQVSGGEFNLATGTHFTPSDLNQQVTTGGISLSNITLTVKVEPTASTLYRVLKAWEAEMRSGTVSTRTFRRSSPDASTSGSQQQSGEAYLSGLGHASLTGGSGNVNTVSATLMPTGTITQATVA